MVEKFKMLFLGNFNSCKSQLAEALVRHMGNNLVEVTSAGLQAGILDPLSIQVLRERNIDAQDLHPKSLSNLKNHEFDLIITLTRSSHEFCQDSQKMGLDGSPSIFQRDPFYLYWPLQEYEPVSGDREKALPVLRAISNELQIKIEALFNHGYIQAFMDKRNHLENLLDILEEGIIVHDPHRRVFLFNKAAERITGVKKTEILGKDCHGIFAPNGLCKGECPFEYGPATPPGHRRYETTVQTPSGVKKKLRMSTAAIELNPGNRPAVILSIKDITEVNNLRMEHSRQPVFHEMVGQSRVMQEIFFSIREVAKSRYPVLISGESGTGKELAARAIHLESTRKDNPFVPINCGALPENILESELFGHVRGAFTGAIREKKGRFELADNGTLFLDEIGELYPSLQVHLLRVLQEQSFEKVGGEKSISVDVRIVSATNKDLKKLVHEKIFREDLYYRLCVVPIHLPPLRERKEDIPLIVERIAGSIRKESHVNIESVSTEVMDRFMEYHWPGNVRELVNAMQFASIYCKDGKIQLGHLPPEIMGGANSWHIPMDLDDRKDRAQTGKRKRLDLPSIRQALEETNGNKVKAAKLLGVGRATLYRFLKENDL
ncbi:MAG: PAS domain S-box protein [Deltaproteobacteria bacterium]|nr:PAS domain S-box protein [Deltaproteobacteria bacterium]